MCVCQATYDPGMRRTASALRPGRQDRATRWLLAAGGAACGASRARIMRARLAVHPSGCIGRDWVLTVLQPRRRHALSPPDGPGRGGGRRRGEQVHAQGLPDDGAVPFRGVRGTAGRSGGAGGSGTCRGVPGGGVRDGIADGRLAGRGLLSAQPALAAPGCEPLGRHQGRSIGPTTPQRPDQPRHAPRRTGDVASTAGAAQ